MNVKHKNTGLLILAGCLFAVCILCIGVFAHLAGLLDSQQAASRWQGQQTQSYTQVSCSFPADQRAQTADIDAFRDSMKKKLSEMSLEHNGEIRLWNDAYSAQQELEVGSVHGSVKADAIGIGGDYFFFHPLPLQAGSYISETYFSQDRVVIDEQIAWKLFGSVDLAGMNLQINQKKFVIAGVVSHENDPFYKKDDQSKGTIYLPYDAFLNITEAKITSYEVVLPDPIAKFGIKLVQDGFTHPQKEVIENKNRFHLRRILPLAMHPEQLIVHSTGIAYPDWENAARKIQFRQIVLVWIFFLSVVFPLGCAVRSLKQGIGWLKKWMQKQWNKLHEKENANHVE